MAQIVELRGMSDDRLEELLENGREEMFNLRFQLATAQLEDVSRVRKVRREIAQLETVLHQRALAAEAAANDPRLADALRGQEWQTDIRFDYEDSAWRVSFVDDNGTEFAMAHVNLNFSHPKSKRRRERSGARELVSKVEVAG